MIESHLNGELVDAGDARSIVEIISRWSSDREQLQAVRIRAQQTVQQHDWNQIAAQTINIYEQVLRRVAGESAPRHTCPDTLMPARAIWQRNGKPAISICICTSNRPAVLRRCLASIEQSEVFARRGDRQ